MEHGRGRGREAGESSPKVVKHQDGEFPCLPVTCLERAVSVPPRRFLPLFTNAFEQQRKKNQVNTRGRFSRFIYIVWTVCYGCIFHIVKEY